MCGIAGIWNLSPARDLRQVIAPMTSRLSHRGPDDHGIFLDQEAGLALGHRRLSIQDLSPAGAQPMTSASGRYVMVFNGEVYNFRALRQELASQGACFEGGSDSEVILSGFDHWGIEPTLERMVGMFAIGLWDRRERLLHLIRDRLGIKPLYVGKAGSSLFFASDLASFHKVPGFEANLSERALSLYFRYAYVPDEACIFEGCWKVQPGTLATFRDPAQAPSRCSYWAVQDLTKRLLAANATTKVSKNEPSKNKAAEEQEHIDETERLLSVAVSERMVADVPLGVFLSGGIDSSLVTALMQAQSSTPVSTFSIGFSDAAYNEAPYAAKIASHLGTHHSELILEPEQAMAAIHELPGIYTEPFADSSQLPTLLVCRMAREQVTVTLSGDGGDEVFGGYNRHLWAPRLNALARLLPLRARRALARGLRTIDPGGWDALFQHVSATFPALYLPAIGDKAHKLSRLLEFSTADDLYLGLTSIWPDPATILASGLNASLPASMFSEELDPASLIMLRDMHRYLPGDILTKVDRASMSAGLEVRVPLLDHRVVEHAATLPPDLKIRGSSGKYILRQILSKHVPNRLFERPKAGFGVPLHTWLRGPLRPWVESLVSPESLNRHGIVNAKSAQSCWQSVLKGQGPNQHKLWTILQLQGWLDELRSERSGS